MIIQKKRVRTLKGKFTVVKKGSQLVVGVRLVPSMVPELRLAGFPDGVDVGEASAKKLLPCR
jgi:hypothetical protein